MKNEIKDLFTNEGEELGIGAEEIVLAPDEEIYAEAAQIATASAEDVKYPFIIKYDVNWKEFLLGMIDKCGGVVKEEINDTELAVSVNMAQLKFIKELDCVEKISEYEDEFLTLLRKEKNATMQNAQTMTLTADEPVAMSAVEATEGAEASVACVTSSSTCCQSNSTMETAREIQLEQLVSGQICCPGAEQWFKFTTAGSGTYTIYTTGSLDTEGTLYDCDGFKLEELDNYNGRINFRIVADLATEELHYIKVTEAKQNTGSYQLKVTENTLVDSVSINKSTIFLEKGKTYELPIRPNYTYLNVEGTERIDGLSVSVNPANADEQMVYWSSIGQDVVKVSFGWHQNENEEKETRYQTITAVNIGDTELCVYDWDDLGNRGVCKVYVVEAFPLVTVISCSHPEWIATSNTMGNDMAIAFHYEEGCNVRTPTTSTDFSSCWNEAGECIVIHTHGSPHELFNEDENNGTPQIISTEEIRNLQNNNKIHFIMMTACQTAGGTFNDNVAYWLSKKINPNGIVIANTEIVGGTDKTFSGITNAQTWKVYKNGEIQAPITDVTLTMQKAYDIYKSYK